MLYDPKWEKPKTKALTLAGLIAWLETQPAEGRYNYNCQNGSCLLDRYITSVTGKPSRPTALHWDICGGESECSTITYNQPWTFGAALARAREVRSPQ
jgi:hypothetical protein